MVSRSLQAKKRKLHNGRTHVEILALSSLKYPCPHSLVYLLVFPEVHVSLNVSLNTLIPKQHLSYRWCLHSCHIPPAKLCSFIKTSNQGSKCIITKVWMRVCVYTYIYIRMYVYILFFLHQLFKQTLIVFYKTDNSFNELWEQWGFAVYITLQDNSLQGS